jgi:LysR family transcriptional regulator, regulator for bpeEF and oprC
MMQKIHHPFPGQLPLLDRSPTMDKFKALQIFVVTAQSDSFAAAADKLNLAPSSISKAIARLEDEIQTPLFYRTARSLKLTEIGHLYYDRHCQILNQIEQLDHEIRDRHTTSPKGLLRLGLTAELSQRYILPELHRFTSQYPHITLNISVTNQLLHPLRDNIDAILISGNIPNDGLTYHEILCYQSITCAAPSYLQQHGMPTTLEELMQHQCITFLNPSTAKPLPWTFQTDRAIEIYPEKMPLAFDQYDLIIQAALQSYGIIQIPKHLIPREIHSRQLLPILCNITTPENKPIALAYPAHSKALHHLQIFVHFLKSLSYLGHSHPLSLSHEAGWLTA